MKQRIYLKNLGFLPRLFTQYLTTHKVDSILDVGCGYGMWFNILKENYILPPTAIGVDNDKGMCEYMVNHIPEVVAIHGDASKLSFKKEYFDMATCNHVIEHIKDKGAVLRNIHKSLKKGGVLYISTIMSNHNIKYIYNTKYKLYTSDSMVKKTVEICGFKIMGMRTGIYKLPVWCIPPLRGRLAIPIPFYQHCEILARK